MTVHTRDLSREVNARLRALADEGRTQILAREVDRLHGLGLAWCQGCGMWHSVTRACEAR